MKYSGINEAGKNKKIVEGKSYPSAPNFLTFSITALNYAKHQLKVKNRRVLAQFVL